jgi:SAM-dependent methyltransferase
MYAFQLEREREYVLDSMQRYIRTKPEQVKLFETLVGPYLASEEQVTVLDVGCGIGDLSYYLSGLNPSAQFTGVDNAPFLLEQASRLCEKIPNVTFREADLYALTEHFGTNAFDFSVCKQVLSWLPEYEAALREMMAVTRRAIFTSSLFYDGRIDFNIRVREYDTEAGRDGYNAFYNVYSFPVFRDFCIAQGARDVVCFDFQIGIDLPKPETQDRMGTYTLKLESGERLQVSGALLLPWKIVRIDLEDQERRLVAE